MILTEHDLAFLCAETKLSLPKLSSLLEDDEDLLLEVVAQRPLYNICLNISFPFFVRLTILKETKEAKFDKEEKYYVSDSISVTYPKVYKQSPYLIDKKRFGEQEAQFYLVLAGLFPEYLHRLNERGAPHRDFYIKAAKKGFEIADKKSLANHICDWVGILNGIKKNTWKL